jgi:hypothetical protein
MNVKNAAWGMSYSVFEILQGLLIHPYQTMRQLVRGRVFIWMTFSPVVLWCAAWVVWKVLELVFYSFVPYVGFWVFVALWFTMAIAMYQILLLYLLLRFWRATQ